MKTAALGLAALTWVVPVGTLSCGAPVGGTGTPAPSAAPSTTASASPAMNRMAGSSRRQSAAAAAELASIEMNVCSATPQGSEAARLHPTDVACAPQTVPPRISPPSHSCAMENGRCRSVAAR